jgi:hypothetical protein
LLEIISFLILKKSSHLFLNNTNGTEDIKSFFSAALSIKILLLVSLLNLLIKNKTRVEIL